MPADPEHGRRVERALLSVQDKGGLPELAAALRRLSVELWATSGTRSLLEARGSRAQALEELTGVDAWFHGRVKTLHPAVFGGILAPRTPEGLAELTRLRLRPFDLVVVNFYPFQQHLEEQPGASDREEFIDIGGLALARAAAKNHAYVAVLSDPSDYGAVVEELEAHGGSLSAETRRRLAVRTFARCSRYDAVIAQGLAPHPSAASPFPEELAFGQDGLRLRYGENPHQSAATYRWAGVAPFDEPPLPLELLKGDTLSYTNLLDLDTAVGLVEEFETPAAAVVKHATPCGVATADRLGEAVRAAIATDPVARYGCAVAVNRPMAAEETAAFHGVFVDLLAAPDFSPEALTALARRPKLKAVRAPIAPTAAGRWEARSALGRLLVQSADRRPLGPGDLRQVSGAALDAGGLGSLVFAWNVVRHAKSNAIVLAQGKATVGVGSGQPTRVKAVELACEVAGARARGAVLASDAFFPFVDGIDAAARAGVRAVLQPGGSVRDAEVIAAAERAGIAMYFSGWRVFRH